MEISRENLYVDIGAWEYKYEIQYTFIVRSVILSGHIT